MVCHIRFTGCPRHGAERAARGRDRAGCRTVEGARARRQAGSAPTATPASRARACVRSVGRSARRRWLPPVVLPGAKRAAPSAPACAGSAERARGGRRPGRQARCRRPGAQAGSQRPPTRAIGRNRASERAASASERGARGAGKRPRQRQTKPAGGAATHAPLCMCTEHCEDLIRVT